MSRGAPTIKGNPSLIESTNFSEGATSEKMIRNEAKLWQDYPNMHWSDVSIKANNH